MDNSNNSYSFLKTLFRGLPVIIFSMLLSLFVAREYLKYATPEYESTAKIKLADIHNGIADGKLYKDFDVFASSNQIDAEVELLKSESLVKKAIVGLPLKVSIYRIGKLCKKELYIKSPFIVTAHVSDSAFYDNPVKIKIYRDSLVELRTDSGEDVKGSFNHPVKLKGAELFITRNDLLFIQKNNIEVNDNYEFTVNSENQLINKIIADLDVMSVDKDVPVLRISYKCPVPQKSADVVNALSEEYIADYVQERVKSADTTETFLKSQLKTYSQNLASSENNIEDYRDKHNIVNIQQETETDLRKIADLKKELASVQMSLNAIDSLNYYISTGKDHFLELAPNYEEFTDLLSTELVKKIKELQQDKQDLLLKYTPENEKVKVIDDKLKDITDYLQESIKNSKISLRIKYNNLQQSITDAEQVFVGLPGREKNMGILDRNFDLNDQTYRFLSEKRTEADIAKAATISFHRIISVGEVPEKPVSPNVIIITILAGILGLFSGVFLVFGVHSLKARVSSLDIIHRLSDTPVAASIPYYNYNKTNKKPRFLKSWVLQMELKGALNEGMVITVTSFKPLEGKTFISTNLELEAALLDKKTLLLIAEQELKGELEKPSNWKKHIELLRSEFDLIIIKNFPISENPVSIMLMAVANLNLLMLDSRRTKKNCIEEADALKDELNLPNMQFVLNRAGYIPSLLTQVKELFHKKFKKAADEDTF